MERKQLHEREDFAPVNISGPKVEEKNAKRSGVIKARTVADGSTRSAYLSEEDAASPMVMAESISLTATVEAKESRDVTTFGVPNALIQTKIAALGSTTRWNLADEAFEF